MHNVLSLSIFYRKTTKSKKLEFSDREKDTLNKKKIIKLEVLKRWQSDYKTKNSPIIGLQRYVYSSTIKYEVLNRPLHLYTTLHALPSCYPSG